ncbi:SigE family RNA polymerase sigma factor [Actinomadura rugatobispora]|uniref:SigE family RNA polymerase sigma factor n=1 Tax=Actinomadura rugatobispora TaxID=1994 RepID=A0ABW1A1S8_9ACTN|nr:SigE family RNA polymerase sigma factor [Actinomadura rugatobispora]
MKAAEEEDFVAYVTVSLPRLRRIAHYLCKDAHRADDVVQMTLTRLYTHWRRAQQANDLDRYVEKMLVRCFLNDQQLGWWSRVRLSGAPRDTPAQAPAPPGPDVETRTVLHTALARLPPKQRAVLVLRFLCDLSVAETAEILQCSTGNVKSQTSRGLATLRGLLGEHMPAILRGE